MALHLQAALQWAAASGWTGILAFIGIDVLFCLLFLPGNLVAMGAGAVFGVGPGFWLVSAANLIGASLAFQLGRTTARDWVEKKVGGDSRFQAVETAVEREGWKIVALSRFAPILPFSVLNYAFGLTRVSLKDYVLATAVSMLPSNFLHVYLGSLVAGAVKGQPWPGWTAPILVSVATVLAFYFINKVMRRALAEAEAAKKRD
jgi:uncharacterized membrane protein YdjX (TVP38/TMEM64 family)